MVSILYRTHKSLSSTTAKIWSLYVFDALSRAAKGYVIKHNVSGDIFTQPGNPATFLLKIGGVVEGLFQDMIASGNSESKVGLHSQHVEPIQLYEMDLRSVAGVFINPLRHRFLLLSKP